MTKKYTTDEKVFKARSFDAFKEHIEEGETAVTAISCIGKFVCRIS